MRRRTTAREFSVGAVGAQSMRGGENNDGKYPHMISYLLSRTQAWYMANGTGRTAVRRMYRRIVPLSRMLHNGVGHGTPFVLSTPLARPLACPSMALWDAGRCTVGGDGPRSNGLKESCQRGVRRAGHVRRQIT